MSMCRVLSCVVGRGCLLWPACSLGKTVSLCHTLFCTPRPNLLLLQVSFGFLPDVGKDWRQEEKGTAEGEMVGQHHWLYWQEFEQALGDDEGQASLVCCSPWGRKKSDTTEWLNWTELKESESSLAPGSFLSNPASKHLPLYQVQNNLFSVHLSLSHSKWSPYRLFSLCFGQAQFFHARTVAWIVFCALHCPKCLLFSALMQCPG